MIRRCDKVFAGPTYTFPDGQQKYSKPPFITVRFLRGRSDVHTLRSGATHIIPMLP
jgi:hypothetical protein